MNWEENTIIQHSNITVYEKKFGNTVYVLEIYKQANINEFYGMKINFKNSNNTYLSNYFYNIKVKKVTSIHDLDKNILNHINKICKKHSRGSSIKEFYKKMCKSPERLLK